MSGNPGTGSRVCIRCRQPLPMDVTYCVGCGCQNEPDSVYAKQVGFDQEIENRQFWLKFRMALGRIFPFLR